MLSLCNVSEIVRRGELTDVPKVASFLDYIASQMKIKSLKGSKLLLSETSFPNKRNKSQLAELLFESKEVRQLFFANHGSLGLYGAGMIEGLILDSGEGVTQIVPVYNGTKLDFAIE